MSNLNIIEAHIDEYGHLKNINYKFSTSQLTLVYGLNEAGKSTLFHFIETILFGFSKKKQELEHFMPEDATQYGGYCVIQLDQTSYIKITRHQKRHKGSPIITKLEKHNNAYQVVEEQLLHQDEFDKLYLSGLTRDMFRDLCALTLDELQAASMKDDEQLNQHLYHATWESSKMIAKLEDESSKIVEKLYRPRGTKQEINQLLVQYKEVKSTLYNMENELDAFMSIKQKLAELKQEEYKWKEKLDNQAEALALLQKVEHDFPLYEQYEALKYEQGKLEQHRQHNKEWLTELQQYFILKAEKQTLIDELQNRKQQLQYEIARYNADHALIAEQRQVVEQYHVIEALLDDIETRKEEAKKLAQYIKQKCHIGSTAITQGVVDEQLWSNEQLEQLTYFEAQDKHVKQNLEVLQNQKEQSEQKYEEIRNQLLWINGKQQELKQEEASLAFTFVPQHLDKLIKSEAAYEESYKRISVHLKASGSATSIYATRSRIQQKEKRGELSAFVLVLSLLAIIVSTVLLVSQFTVTNLLVVLLILCGVSFFVFQQLKPQKNSSYLHDSFDVERERQDFFNTLHQLIVIPDTDYSEWTHEQDYELRKMLQLYKNILRASEQNSADKANLEKQLYELTYQIEKHTLQIVKLEQQDKQRELDWQMFMKQAQLPEHATIQSIRVFVSQLDEIKDNIASYKHLQNRLSQDEKRIDDYRQRMNSLLKKFTEQEERLEYGYMLLRHQYDEHLQAYKQLQQLEQQHVHITEQLEILQAPLTQRATELKSFVGREENDEEMWKIWVDVEVEWERFNLDLFRIEQQRRQFVSPEQLIRLNELYKHHAYNALLEQVVHLQIEVEQLKKQITLTVEERGQLQERLNNLSSTYERQQLQLQHDSLEEQIKQRLKQYAKYALVDFVVKKTRTQFEAEHQPALMMKASQYIHQLTEGKYQKLVLHPDTKSFQLASKNMSLVPIERLSRGTAELVYFSLRIALLTTHKALIAAPLILDDPFVNFDENRLKSVMSFMYELASHRQIIFLTCHEHILHKVEQRASVVNIV